MKRAHSDDEDNVLPCSMFPSPPLAPWWRPMLCNVGGFWFSGEEKLDGEKTSDTKGRLSTTTLTHAQMGLHTRTQKSWTVGAWSTNVENFRPQSESENLAPPSLCNTIKKKNKTFQAEEKADRRSTVDFVVNVYQLSSISRLAAASKHHNMWHLTLYKHRSGKYIIYHQINK